MVSRSVGILLLFLAGACPLAQGQVHRSDTGLGGALIVPYWTSANDNDTLLSIRNDGDAASVAKVRILDDHGVLQQSFNLYLDAYEVWTAGFTQVDDLPRLLLREGGCFLPTEVAGETAFQLPAIELENMRGSIEIIEMARAPDTSQWADSGRWAECDVLADAFESGDWRTSPNTGLGAPSQRLSATASVINVPVGGMNTVAATALGGFSDVAQHTAPDNVAPGLDQPVDSGAAEGQTRSLVCTGTGCRTDAWSLPVQAVAAALSVGAMRVDYSVSEPLVASFDWMIHRPLERYEGGDDGFVIHAPPTLTVRDRAGAPFGVSDVCVLPPPGYPECGESAFPLDSGLVHQNLAFNAEAGDAGVMIESAVLGHPTIVWPGFALGDPSASEFHEGSAEFRFDPSAGESELLVAADGTEFVGEPVIGFAVQQFTNGTVIDRSGQAVLANYRGTEPPRRTLRLESGD